MYIDGIYVRRMIGHLCELVRCSLVRWSTHQTLYYGCCGKEGFNDSRSCVDLWSLKHIECALYVCKLGQALLGFSIRMLSSSRVLSSITISIYVGIICMYINCIELIPIYIYILDCKWNERRNYGCIIHMYKIQNVYLEMRIK